MNTISLRTNAAGFTIAGVHHNSYGVAHLVRPADVRPADTGSNRPSVNGNAICGAVLAGAPILAEGIPGFYNPCTGCTARAKMQAAPTGYQRPTLHDVPAGRYAVNSEEGVLRFFQVDKPTEGRWAGHTFVKVQAGDDLHNVKGAAKTNILTRIALDPAAASKRYGQEIGSCGVCGRTLTDADSRAAGIGPVCSAKTGW